MLVVQVKKPKEEQILAERNQEESYFKIRPEKIVLISDQSSSEFKKNDKVCVLKLLYNILYFNSPILEFQKPQSTINLQQCVNELRTQHRGAHRDPTLDNYGKDE